MMYEGEDKEKRIKRKDSNRSGGKNMSMGARKKKKAILKQMRKNKEQEEEFRYRF